MAIPENHSRILTNISRAELEEVLKAIEEKRVKVVPGSYSLFAESGSWQIDFNGARYSVNESTEEISSLFLIRDEQLALL